MLTRKTGTELLGWCVLILTYTAISEPTRAGNGIDPTLIAWWSFDNEVQEGSTITDESGNGFDAIRQGGALLVSDGITDQAMSFDGVDDYLNVPMGVLEGFNVGNFRKDDFTISLWMKTATPRIEGVIGKRIHCTGGHNFWDFRINSIHTMQVEMYEDNNILNRTNISGRRILNDGLWHQLVLTRQGTTVSLFLDGKQDLSTTYGHTANLFNAADVWIGRSQCSNGSDGTRYYTGLLDEIRVYGRALSCQEIRADFEAFFDVRDFNRDEMIDFNDALYLASQWLETGVATPAHPISPADIAPGCGDGTVNYFDFAALVSD